MIAARGIAPKKIAPPPKVCPLTIKFSPEIVASSQANYSQAVLWVNWRKLCIVCEYDNQRIILPKAFLRQQIRIKKWFTSIYLLQILAKPCRTSLIREHLSLNASWSYTRTKKIIFFWKIYSEKNTKKLHSK